jgi:hypothetical protein
MRLKDPEATCLLYRQGAPKGLAIEVSGVLGIPHKERNKLINNKNLDGTVPGCPGLAHQLL